jgi:hypothetical protein
MKIQITNEIKAEIKTEQERAMNRIRKEFATYQEFVNWDFISAQYAYVTKMNEALERGEL